MSNNDSTQNPQLDANGQPIVAPAEGAGNGQGGADGGADGGEGKHDNSETPEAKYARLKRQTEQHAKKYGFKDEERSATPSKKSKSGSLDYSQKAFLASIAGVKTQEEYAFVQDMLETTGQPLDSLIESNYFKFELKGFREQKAVETATPSSGKRTTSPTRDTVEYWIAKDELPPADQVELRRKVVNAKMAKEGSGSPFSDTPVVK